MTKEIKDRDKRNEIKNSLRHVRKGKRVPFKRTPFFLLENGGKRGVRGRHPLLLFDDDGRPGGGDHEHVTALAQDFVVNIHADDGIGP